MSNDHIHILSLFGNALSALRQDILRMASVTSENLRNATRGLVDRNDDLCNKAIADDEEVDHLEMQIDREGQEIIMRFSPVAADFRQVMATMKMANNFERISDQAVNIAKRARKMNRYPELPETKLIEPIYDMAASLLDTCVAAFRDGDVAKALSLDALDDPLDKAQRELSKKLTQRSEEDPERVGGYINLIFITRFLERIGDRAVNIGEDCVYAKSAKDIRHGGEHPATD